MHINCLAVHESNLQGNKRSIDLGKLQISISEKLRVLPRNKYFIKSLMLFLLLLFLSYTVIGVAPGSYSKEFQSWDKNGNAWEKNNLKGYNILDCVPTYQTITNTGTNPLTHDVILSFNYVVGTNYGVTGFYYCGAYNPPSSPTFPLCTSGLELGDSGTVPYGTITKPTFPSTKPTGSTTLQYVWHITNLPAGQSVTLSYCAKLSNEVQNIPGSSLQIASSDGGTTSMPCGGDVGAPDLLLAKDGTPSCGKITYTLTYSNSNAANSIPQTSTKIADDYDESKVALNESSISSAPVGVTHSISNGIIIWNIPGSVNPGASGTITYAMDLLTGVISGPIINTAQISGYYGDRNLADNSVTRTIASVQASPTIGTQPADKTVCVGASEATFQVVASGPGTLGYQWYQGTSPLTDDAAHIVGSITNTLHIKNVVLTDAGNYHVRITSNPGGCYVDSSTAILIVSGKPTINALPDEAICVEDILPLHGTGTGFDPTTAAWSVENGPGGTFAEDPEHIGDLTYRIFDPNIVSGLQQRSTIRFTVTGFAPCSSTTSDEMFVDVFSKTSYQILLKAPTDP